SKQQCAILLSRDVEVSSMLRILKVAFIIQQSETPGFHAWNLKTREEPSEALPVVSRRIVHAPGGAGPLSRLRQKGRKQRRLDIRAPPSIGNSLHLAKPGSSNSQIID